MSEKIAIIGLGYVGLPLAVEFAKFYKVLGYDLNISRVNELNKFYDRTNEISVSKLKKVSTNLKISSDILDLKKSNIYIVTVPTPIKKNLLPDLKYIKHACYAISDLIKNNDIVVIESTVYPGLTEEVCASIIEKKSGLKYLKNHSGKNGFYMGYSPERINPGDKKHTISKIKKIVSSPNIFALNKLVKIYSKIIKAGLHKVNKINIAEAAKVIENTQRDINISLINEFSIIFNKMQIDTYEVLKAAETKWNFLPFKPGLVGGHCIGVDPYYLTYKAKKVGYSPKVISAGRNLNKNMPKYVASKLLELMKQNKIKSKNSKLIIFGLTFKEDCPDIRNSGVLKLIEELKKENINIDVFDPLIEDLDINNLHFKLINKIDKNKYDSLIYAVNHKQFHNFSELFYKKLLKKKNVIFDLKNVLKLKMPINKL